MELVSLEQLLKKDLNGKIVCFPTDTVYGVGAVVNDIQAIKKIYALKNRDPNKPLAILVADFNISQYIIDDRQVLPTLKKYWPGALTAIFQSSGLINLLAPVKTIAFRMPNSKIALEIIKHFGLMATTSINMSGHAPLNNKDEIIKHFKDQLDYLVIDEEVSDSLSSTIVDFTQNPYQVIRQGSLQFLK